MWYFRQCSVLQCPRVCRVKHTYSILRMRSCSSDDFLLLPGTWRDWSIGTDCKKVHKYPVVCTQREAPSLWLGDIGGEERANEANLVFWKGSGGEGGGDIPHTISEPMFLVLGNLDVSQTEPMFLVFWNSDVSQTEPMFSVFWNLDVLQTESMF